MSNYSDNNYSKDHPFKASIKERYLLNRPGSKKQTYHIVLDLKGSGISYQVGDSVAVLPVNDPELIEKTLRILKATGEEIVFEKHSGEKIVFRDFLIKKANITEVSRKFIQEIHDRQTNTTKKERLSQILEERETWKAYQESHELWDVLSENSEVVFSVEEIVQLLMPLLPRFYSIASAQSEVGEEVHLTVALLNYSTNGLLRHGVCTHYLCRLAPMHEPVIPIYIQPHKGFTLPESEETPIIMIGPGTGIAPYRAFMQERMYSKTKGKNWLFFGDWNYAYDFFYQEFWEQLVDEEKLRFHLAFSRDQENKIYVQHRMMENAADIFHWIQQGSFVFVCGDAKRMAKDVDATLQQIIQEQGHMTEEEAKAYMKKLRSDKRYLRDVY